MHSTHRLVFNMSTAIEKGCVFFFFLLVYTYPDILHFALQCLFEVFFLFGNTGYLCFHHLQLFLHVKQCFMQFHN